MSAPETTGPSRPRADVGRWLDPDRRAGSALRGRRVLVVGIDYHPAGSGIAPYTTGLAEHLAGAASEVTVLTGVPLHPDGALPAHYRRGRRFPDPGWCRTEGPRVIRLRPAAVHRGGRWRRIAHELSFLLLAAGAGRALAPDLVIGVTPSPSAAAAAAWLARRRGARLITVVQSTVGGPGTGARFGDGPEAAAGTGPGPEPDQPPGGRVGRHRARRDGGLPARLAAAMERYALARSDEVAVASEAFRPAVLAAGVEPGRLHLLPNWTRLATVAESRQSAREALGWPLDRFLVVHAGPMGPRQDLGTAIEAARLLSVRGDSVRRDSMHGDSMHGDSMHGDSMHGDSMHGDSMHGRARHGITRGPGGHGLAEWDRAVLAGAVDLILTGDGSQRAALQQQAFGLDGVRLLDPPDDDTQPLVLAAADLLLLVEAPMAAAATPGLLAGYLSAGRPVLAAACEHGATGCELRRAAGAGVRVDPGDPAALAEAILTLQAAASRRAAMGRSALRYARSQLGQEASLHRLDLIVAAALPDGPLPDGPLPGQAPAPAGPTSSAASTPPPASARPPGLRYPFPALPADPSDHPARKGR